MAHSLKGAIVVFFLVSFLLLIGACGSDGIGAACDPEANPCAIEEEDCFWVHDGADSGYFCALRCEQGECPGGMTCVEGGASSCPTCRDIIHICE